MSDDIYFCIWPESSILRSSFLSAESTLLNFFIFEDAVLDGKTVIAKPMQVDLASNWIEEWRIGLVVHQSADNHPKVQIHHIYFEFGLTGILNTKY